MWGADDGGIQRVLVVVDSGDNSSISYAAVWRIVLTNKLSLLQETALWLEDAHLIFLTN